MTRLPTTCVEIQERLLAVALDEPGATRGGVTDPVLEAHLQCCPRCRDEHARLRALETAVGAWRRLEPPAADLAGARARLDARLADLSRRTFTYHVVPSPLGNILIARSEHGVSLVEYLGRRRDPARSRLGRLAVEARPDGAELEALGRELLEYLAGRRTRLDWPLDLRLVRSAFHRAVLDATARIPYGAVISYAGLACEVGKPTGVRAVAQALRWNPLPIVVPCHRVIGSGGSLTGYAGNRTDLKERLLTTEGVRVVRVREDLRVLRQAMYVRTPSARFYCLPTCRWLARFPHPERLVLFGAREGAEAAGLRPCTECRPDLRPLPA